ncbi:MAG: phosphatidylglycerol---prolipoprotein diacylglyceryl transferase [Acidimicrobiaceae bacterium]|nr:phosphatidylglycerol---prolipoprotein diacylglyceryl transferase [Acidimicrobiaceae bacterium]
MGRLQVAAVDCDPVADAEPQALGVTYWFDAAPEGERYRAAVHFVGHRLGVEGIPGPRDSFTVSETVEHVPPGCGRIAITSRIVDIAPGEWRVTARLDDSGLSGPAFGRGEVSGSGATGFLPVLGVRAPGTHLGAWPALVGAGVAVALALQTRLAAHAHLPAGRVLLVSLLACLAGLLGARIYYIAQHEVRSLARPRALLGAGMCVQGFVISAVATATLAAIANRIPAGVFLNGTAPALLIGMCIGRLGCFFGGCCAGRPTASRWGVWSSDRRLGMRRIPTQLLESALCLALAAGAFAAGHSSAARPPGAVFVGAIASYILGRQLLLPLRDLPRTTSYGRLVATAVSATVVLAELVAVTFT